MEKDRYVPKRSFKYKYELGLSFPDNFKYPEVFSRKKPNIVPDPWEKRSTAYFIRAIIETPPKMLRRRIGNDKEVGY
jgi:hypothetical protein